MTQAAKAPPRFLVGIDLGTTHTVVAYADTAKGGKPKIAVFNIDQLTAPGAVASRPLLPSVRYHPAEDELTEADTRLPWSQTAEHQRPVIGELARALGGKTHGRTVASAKSWLSHGAVDRTAPILPWGAALGVERISPLEASASYLAHVRAAWNQRFPEDPMEKQEIVVTVPASFDEAARTLTLEATRLAGLEAVRLLEEPQAACYDWIWRHRQNLSQHLSGARLLLVVDVGGGTTDLSLIHIEAGTEEPKLTRIGVGDHLMLGGDNLDLALAHLVEPRLVSDRRLGAGELSQIVEQCRTAKESLLAEHAPQTVPITLLGAGARLIGGTRSTELSRDKVRQIVLDGFFPLTAQDEMPERKRSAVVEFGLPYASDPAISKHIAAFLAQHRQAMEEALATDGEAQPDAVLFNGGLFRSPCITDRVLELLGSWQNRPPKLLRNDHPDLAVAHGAVAFGLARRGLSSVQIGGGSARAYFLLLDSVDPTDRQGVCLLPKGSMEGHEVFLADRSFALTLGVPVRFHLVSSIADTHWQAGELAPIDDEHFVALPPLAVAFDRHTSQGKTEVVVRLAASLTDIGTLDIQCVDAADPERRWNVEFQLRRHKPPPAHSASPTHPKIGEAQEIIHSVFGKKTRDIDSKRIKGLRVELEKLLGKRDSWDTPLLRELFAALLEGLPHRRRSDAHERLWLSLTGFCLRPGFGYPLDEWRVAQIEAIYPQGIQYQQESQNWAEWWTLWRRIAGGLDAEAQGKLFATLADFINPDTAKRANLQALAKKRSYEDMLRLVAVLERLPLADKTALGHWLLTRLRKPGEPAETAWALGRVGARIPFHSGIQGVVGRDTAEDWLVGLLAFDWKKHPSTAFAATLIARMTGDRERDISAETRAKVLDKLRAAKAAESWQAMVESVKELDEADEKRSFGEALPPGLKLLG